MTAERAGAKPADAYHHGDLRRALLDAAMAAVEGEGAEAVSLAAIARTLGVSQAAPYRHFPDREALLASVAAEGFRMFDAALRGAAAEAAGRPVLFRMSRAYVTFGLARPGLYRLMFDSPLLARAREGDDLKSVALGSFALLVEAVGPGGERRALRIWVALHGTVMLAARSLLGDQPAPVTLDALLEDILS